MKVFGVTIVLGAVLFAIACDHVLGSTTALGLVDGTIPDIRKSQILACLSKPSIDHLPSASASVDFKFSNFDRNPLVACLTGPTAGSMSSMVANPITDLLFNIINGIIANVTAPISDVLDDIAQLNLTNILILGPLTNLTNENFTNSPILGILENFTSPILDPLTNLPTAVNLSAPIVSPALSKLRILNNGTIVPVLDSLDNLTDALIAPLTTLTDILGMLINLTNPLQGVFDSNLTFYTNITVTISLDSPSISFPSIFSPIPNTVTVLPMGMTKVSFYIFGFEENMTAVQVTFTIPAIYYLTTRVSDSATVSLNIPTGSTVAIMGLTKSVVHFFPGLAWQTFPQLKKVSISKLVPGSARLHSLYNLTIPSLICKSNCY